MRKANCIICGKEFETNHSTQKTCGFECHMIHSRKQSNKYYWDHRIDQLQKNKEYSRTHKKPIVCILCGKEVPRNPTGHRSRMHDDCVYDDIIDTINSGREISYAQRSRLGRRGYTVKEFLSEYVYV